MQIQVRSQRAGQDYFDRISCKEFSSTLEVPSGQNPAQNAWLTITINYSFVFVDQRTPSGIALRQGDQWVAKDSDGKVFPLRDWDRESMSDFVKRFQAGQDFWNYKFLLITPKTYDKLDFTSQSGMGFVCRPNVICLLRLVSGGTPEHLAIKVVRLNQNAPNNFRSESRLYESRDVGDKTLWHELGHSLDQLHIRALLGDANCLVDINAGPCYVTPSFMPPNIMGLGSNLGFINAKPWRELIAEHTKLSQSAWSVSMSVNQPPRKIPIGVQMVAPVTEF